MIFPFDELVLATRLESSVGARQLTYAHVINKVIIREVKRKRKMEQLKTYYYNYK